MLLLLARSFSVLQQRQIGKLDFPSHLVFYVTSACNLCCSHCFYTPNVVQRAQFSLDEIKKICAHLNRRLLEVTFTGGEPFLRSDLAEIALIFRAIGCRALRICTNGSFPEATQKFVDTLMRAGIPIGLTFQLSWNKLYSLEKSDEGDKIRQTLRVLHEYRKLHPASISKTYINTTISRNNIDFLEQLINDVQSLEAEVEHTFNFIRSADTHTFGVNTDVLSGLNAPPDILLSLEEMRHVLKVLDATIWAPDCRVSLSASANRQYFLEAIRIIEKKTSRLKCLSGRRDIILLPDGSVAVCEMLKPFGRIQDTNLDLLAFYELHRRQFETPKGCKCIHDCSIVPSITCCPEALAEMAGRRL